MYLHNKMVSKKVFSVLKMLQTKPPVDMGSSDSLKQRRI